MQAGLSTQVIDRHFRCEVVTPEIRGYDSVWQHDAAASAAAAASHESAAGVGVEPALGYQDAPDGEVEAIMRRIRYRPNFRAPTQYNAFQPTSNHIKGGATPTLRDLAERVRIEASQANEPWHQLYQRRDVRCDCTDICVGLPLQCPS